MKRTVLFIAFLAALSAVSGYLMSQMSWIGRLGINLMHHEYKFLKVWWQGGALVFGVLFFLFLLQSFLHRSLNLILARVIHLAFLGAAVYGVYFTYTDFNTDFTHSLLKQRFHLGAYLFWVGWMSICIFYFFSGKEKVAVVKTPDKMASANQ